MSTRLLLPAGVAEGVRVPCPVCAIDAPRLGRVAAPGAPSRAARAAYADATTCARCHGHGELVEVRAEAAEPSREPGCDASAAARCAWCKGPMPPEARRDAITCSKPCRQARHRFNTQVERVASTDRPLALAYADPPYPGLSKRYYKTHPDYAGEVDHVELLGRLSRYDGWALSTSAPALPDLLVAAHDLGVHARVASWVRGERASGVRHRPASAWEPVLYVPAREGPGAWPGDALVVTPRARTTDPARVVGAKPAAFCSWLFGLLGARSGDTLDDLFPGSGGVRRAWDASRADERDAS